MCYFHCFQSCVTSSSFALFLRAQIWVHPLVIDKLHLRLQLARIRRGLGSRLGLGRPGIFILDRLGEVDNIFNWDQIFNPGYFHQHSIPTKLPRDLEHGGRDEPDFLKNLDLPPVRVGLVEDQLRRQAPRKGQLAKHAAIKKDRRRRAPCQDVMRTGL